MTLILCNECNEEISSEANACPNCGYPVGSTNKKRRVHISSRNSEKKESKIKHRFIAAILSFVFPGLGQLYNRDYQKMLIIFLLISLHPAIILTGHVLDLFPVQYNFSNPIYSFILIFAGMVYFVGIYFYAIIDAYYAN